MLSPEEIEARFGHDAPAGPQPFPPFGEIVFPFTKLGRDVSSTNLFNPIEQRIFDFYWRNRDRYRLVADVGANIGLHTLVMLRCGFAVSAYEPDPATFAMLEDRVRRNEPRRRTMSSPKFGSGLKVVCLDRVTLVQAAVSDVNGMAEFWRLGDNITGSCLTGHKPHWHGSMERITVPTIAASLVIGSFDLVKMDIESHEAIAICSVPAEAWDYSDVMLEISSEANAAALFDYARRNDLRIFCERIGWRAAVAVGDLPFAWSHGSAFMTRKAEMP